jgi:hypothetical protein
MRKLLYMLFGGALTLALVFGGYAAFAQTDDETATPTPSDETTDEGVLSERPFRGQRGNSSFFGGRGGMMGDRQTLLAEALGISVAELEAAQAEAHAAALQEAVAAGLITQEEADLMAAGQLLRGLIERDAIMAQVLGVTVEELQAAKTAGTMQALVEASGLTQAEIMTAMQEAHAAAIAQVVADGLITQEQADALQSGPGFGGMRGGNRGHGGMGHGGMGHGNMGQGGMGGRGFNGDCPMTTPNIGTSNQTDSTSGGSDA